jgi:hypothetical protein
LTTVVVMLVLAVAWAVVLMYWLRDRAPTGLGSITTFSRHLRLLGRTGPHLVRPANRMYGPEWEQAGMPPPRPFHPRVAAPARFAVYPAAAYRPTPGRLGVPAPTAAALCHRRRLKRRRDVLLTLVGAALFTAVLGAIPGLHPILFVQGLFDLLLIGYLWLLVRTRALHGHREATVAYLHPVGPDPAGQVPEGTGR